MPEDRDPETRYVARGPDGKVRPVGPYVAPATGGRNCMPEFPLHDAQWDRDGTPGGAIREFLGSVPGEDAPASESHSWFGRALLELHKIGQESLKTHPDDDLGGPYPWPPDADAASELEKLIRSAISVADRLPAFQSLTAFLADLAVMAADQRFHLTAPHFRRIEDARAELIKAEAGVTSDPHYEKRVAKRAVFRAVSDAEMGRAVLDTLDKHGVRSRARANLSAERVTGSDEIGEYELPSAQEVALHAVEGGRDILPVRGVPVHWLPGMVRSALAMLGIEFSQAIYDERIDALLRAGAIAEETGSWRGLDGRPESGPVCMLASDAGVRDHADAGNTDSFAGFVPADTLELRHGIRRSRLSEAARTGRVKTKPAPPGVVDSQGRAVRQYYNEQQAIEHCSPKRVTAKTRNRIGIGSKTSRRNAAGPRKTQ